jgi:cell division protein FtsL
MYILAVEVPNFVGALTVILVCILVGLTFYIASDHQKLLNKYDHLQKNYNSLLADYNAWTNSDKIRDPVTLLNGYVISEKEKDFILQFFSGLEIETQNRLANYCNRGTPLISDYLTDQGGRWLVEELNKLSALNENRELNADWKNVIYCATTYKGVNRLLKIVSPIDGQRS